MGFSLIISEAEHFLIWWLSICNLSFVDFLFIPSSLPPSLSPDFPWTFSRNVLNIYLLDSEQAPVDTDQGDTVKDSTYLGPKHNLAADDSRFEGSQE